MFTALCLLITVALTVWFVRDVRRELAECREAEVSADRSEAELWVIREQGQRRRDMWASYFARTSR